MGDSARCDDQVLMTSGSGELEGCNISAMMNEAEKMVGHCKTGEEVMGGRRGS
ncbi:hypothetical protein FIBSPDRAFT_859043 [Athelia psychrophila]|uniref:Uncharacterized protein n=1 Tax=Athelia psychrophila TaxID=1759441 RepID=A0A166LLQ7_9AGAM|nr:hypothetical protein FIBSPDRAFT_859043 [Fibularhizoctonia sp. CBS 109695]